MRKSGVLLPLFSLNSNYGIGTFGKAAYDFIDFLVESKQSFWQILPLGATGYGDSPYQSFSSFAGNPYFIDLDILCEDNLITIADIKNFLSTNENSSINYEKIYNERFKILNKAFLNSRANTTILKKIEIFKIKHKNWLYDYALFMAIKKHFHDKSWFEWDMKIRKRDPATLNYYKTILSEEIDFQIFVQAVFFDQWLNLKSYANQKGIKIIGDIPIYVAEDSCDIWTNAELFKLNDDLIPLEIAGCPPDEFSDTGQLWGNPIYDWSKMKDTNYIWWIERIKAAMKIFDVIRIDHFRGFESYWSVPYGSKISSVGKWNKGPGLDLFNHINKNLKNVKIIAEDLGFMTNEVKELLENCGYPGMKLLQFGFNELNDNPYLPHNYKKNSVVYTGTHDNDTIIGWFKDLPIENQLFFNKYCKRKSNNDVWSAIEVAFASVSDTVIIPMQDLLEFGSESRINRPSTLGGNWNWRIQQDDLNSKIITNLLELNKLYKRN